MRIISVSCMLVLLAALGISATAQAQQQTLPGLGDPKAPLEIEADNGLELFQDRNLVVAKGNVVARQGLVVLHSDILSASYEDSPQGQRRIRRIDAVGNVRIETEKERLFGDHVTYDLVRELMVVTGEGLRIEAQNQTIKADKSLEFWGAEQRAVARGNAQVSQEGTTLRADVIEAQLSKRTGKNANSAKSIPAKASQAKTSQAKIAGLPSVGAALTSGNTSLERIRAWGNVVITTPTEIVEGDQGDYDVPNQLATLSGNVQITRGKNKLSGEQAIVNLKTGVSRLTGGKSGRVRTILFPGGSAESGATKDANAKSDRTANIVPVTPPATDAPKSATEPAQAVALTPPASSPVPVPPPFPVAKPPNSMDKPAANDQSLLIPIPPSRTGTAPDTGPGNSETATQPPPAVSDATAPNGAGPMTNTFGAPVPPPRKRVVISDGLLPRPRPQGAQ
jgi:lipopolysaccharide export system protein LptA